MIVMQNIKGIFLYGSKKLDSNGLSLFFSWMARVKRIALHGWISLEREKACKSERGEGAERGERILSRLHAQCRPWCGAPTHEYEIMVHGWFFKIFLMFYWFFRERETESMSRGGSEREGDTESEAGSRLWAVSQSLTRGSNPQAVRSWPVPKSDA